MNQSKIKKMVKSKKAKILINKIIIQINQKQQNNKNLNFTQHSNMDKRDFAFSKTNYIMLAIGFAIVILGFILMGGESTTEEAFNPDIFSTRRIVVAPMVCLAGFIFVVVAILWKSKSQKADDTEDSLDKEITEAK